MCAKSETVIGGEDVFLYLGYHGGELTIGEFVYKQNQGGKHRVNMIDKLNTFTKYELMLLIIGIVDMSEEA